MRKNKIKMSLVDDYVKIGILNNLFEKLLTTAITQNTKDNIQKQIASSTQLKIVYDVLFELLKINDVSLLILKNDLNQNNALFYKLKQDNFSHLDEIIKKASKDIDTIALNLKEKLKALNIDLKSKYLPQIV